jgi:hypothetical protein
VKVEAYEARREPAFLWFTRDGKAYLVSDAESLARVRALPTPVAPDETLGEQLRRLADELLGSGAARLLDQ